MRTSVKKYILCFLGALAFFLSSSSLVRAQLSGLSVSAGFANAHILGDNLAAKPFRNPFSDDKFFGGSLDGGHPGLRMQMNFALDDGGIFEIPISFAYIFYMGREKEPISSLSDIKLRHDIYVPSFSLGFNYSFLRFTAFARMAKIYASLESRATYVTQGTFESIQNYVEFNEVEKLSHKTKEAAWRFGGALRLGLNGELNHPWYLDINAGVAAINLIGKDDSRGELLTPHKKTANYTETKESTVYTYRFYLMIQYKL